MIQQDNKLISTHRQGYKRIKKKKKKKEKIPGLYDSDDFKYDRFIFTNIKKKS